MPEPVPSHIGFPDIPGNPPFNGGVDLAHLPFPHAIQDGSALLLQQAFSAADLSVAQMELFFLVLVRVSFIVFLLPFMSNMLVGTMAKVGLTFFLALCIFPTLDTSGVVLMPGAGALLWMVLRECMVGMVVGFVGYMLFAFVEFGAEIINREIGITTMPIVDPGNGEMTTEITLLITMTFSILFLITGGHVILFEAIRDSFQYVPLGGLRFQSQPVAVAFTQMVSESILYGFRFAAPVFVVTTLMAIGLGYMSKMMPTMNIWAVAPTVKVLVGIFTLIYALPLMYKLFGMMFERLHQYMLLSFKLIGAG